MNVTRHSQTYDDIVEIASYLGAENPSVADRFYESVEKTLNALGKTPRLGTPRVSENGEIYRIWFVVGFGNILILYKEVPDGLVILRVIHSAQDYNRFI